MRSIVTMIVQLIVDDSAPDRLCGRVEASLPLATPERAERRYFQDEQQLLEILRSAAKPIQSPASNAEEESDEP
ncbi:MAG TPA: hypothetical protein PLJ24_02295 [Anaerolineae bacterium]|nr:hypothetical protein [Anaerolineae bacterium]